MQMESSKTQYKYIIIGTVISYVSLVTFNFILPAFLYITDFLPLGSISMFPFIFCTGYSILRFRLLNIKAAGILFLIFFITLFALVEVLVSRNLTELLYRTAVFISTVILCVLILKGIIDEIHHREKIEILAGDLKEANEVRTELIALATHHIATPLTAMKGYVSLIQEGIYGKVPSKISPTIEILERSTNSMSNSIRDFLDVSRD
jgi:signal transduction histidine kinase